MDKDTAWSMFETTGDIEAYMLYYDLAEEDGPVVQEDFADAAQNRRSGDPGAQRR